LGKVQNSALAHCLSLTIRNPVNMKYCSYLGFSLIFAFSISSSNGDPECASKLKAAGASDSFAAMVAHGVHSMTLGDLKKFDPLATPDNFVPTIDLNDQFEQTLLPSLPDKGTSNSFSYMTDGMTVLDLVLKHMDDQVWKTANITTIERLVHEFHMREAWAHAKVEFDRIRKDKTLAPSKDACECALDVDNNGIMEILTIMTMGVDGASRTLGEQSLRNLTIDAGKKGFPRNYGYSMYYISFRAYAMRKAASSPSEAKLLEGIAEALPPSVRNAEGWKSWKGKVGMPMEHHRDLALFLHCAVDKAHKTGN